MRTAEEMHRAVRERVAESSVAIMAAAVADFRPAVKEPTKIKRGANGFALELQPTQDILAEVASQNSAANGRRRIVIGFAAETNNLLEHARKKLAEKGADFIVANDVTQPGAGFDVDTNIVTLLFRDARENNSPREERLPKMSKFDVATRVLDELVRMRSASEISAEHTAAPRK